MTKSVAAPFIRAPREDCNAGAAGKETDVKRRDAKIKAKATTLEMVGQTADAGCAEA